MDVWPGRPNPLGATYDGIGTNFALFSEVADLVELCLFDLSCGEERIPMTRSTASCGTASSQGSDPASATDTVSTVPTTRRTPAVQLGQVAPRPCTPWRSTVRSDGIPAVYGYRLGGDERELTATDSAPFMPRAVVTNPWFDWGDDHPLRRQWHEIVLYELHVKGFTMMHRDVLLSCVAPTPDWLIPPRSATCSGSESRPSN